MARRPFRDDEQGQMMILAAVLLVIGLIALAGMVARVNQLGSQTATESNQAILSEVSPLADAIETGIADLQDYRQVDASWMLGDPVVTAPAGTFSAGDVGQAVSGSGIPTWTRIISYNAGTGSVTLSASPTLTPVLPPCPCPMRVGPALLSSTSTPTMEDAVKSMLEQLQRLEASHGFVMDYQLTCPGGAGGNTAQGIVVVHLSDGTVWTEIRTAAPDYFPRSTCASVSG